MSRLRPPERTGKWEQVGTFKLPNGFPDVPAELGTFEIDTVRVPAPPEARMSLRSDWESRSTVSRMELRHACPKCLHECVLGWDQRSNDRIVEMGLAGEHPVAAAVAVEMARHADQSEVEARVAYGRMRNMAAERDRLATFVKEHIEGRYRPSKERIRRAWRKRK